MSEKGEHHSRKNWEKAGQRENAADPANIVLLSGLHVAGRSQGNLMGGKQ